MAESQHQENAPSDDGVRPPRPANNGRRQPARPVQASLRRWIDVLLLSGFGLVLAISVPPFLPPIAATVADTWGAGGPIVVTVLAAVWLGLIIAPLMRLGWFRRGHLSLAIIRYPPSWLTIFLAVAAYGVAGQWLRQFLPWLPTHAPIDFIWCAVAVGGAVILAVLVVPQRSMESPDRQSSGSSQPPPPVGSPTEVLRSLTDQPDRLLHWIAEEAPIEAPEQDWFAAHTIAARLANVMRQHPGDSFGLTGDFGSGKSSILNLVNQMLDVDTPHSSPRLIPVQVSQWGQNDLSAPAHTLQEAVATLARSVDTLAIAGLPRAYAAALQGTSPPWWLAWLAWLSVPDDPTEQLKRLDRIVTSLNAHLVLYLEDIDRNDDPTTLQRTYVQFQAMLDRLRTCQRLTFVLSARGAVFDFSRLCEHRFMVRPPAPAFVGAVAQALRHHARRWSIEAANDIDPFRTQDQIAEMRARVPATEMRLWVPTGHASDHTLPWKEICRVLARPRRLKEALRQTWRIWQVLHGEVDYDVLFVSQVIRTASPQAFGFIQNRRQILTDWEGVLNDQQKKAQREAIKQTWEDYVTDCDEDEKAVLRGLIAWFTGSPIDVDTMVQHQQNPPSPQSVAELEVYWRRIWEEQVDETARPRDQFVLRTIQRWKESREQDLVTGLDSTPGFADVFRHFQSKPRALRQEFILTADELLALGTTFHERVTQRLGVAATVRDSDGAVVCWGLVDNYRSVDGAAYQRWIRAELDRALNVSLALALSIEHFWGAVRNGGMDVNARQELRRFLHVRLQALLEAEPMALAKMLTTSSPYQAGLLRQLLAGADEPDINPFAPADWHWMVPILRDMLEETPDAVVPHLFVVATLTGHRIRRDDMRGPRPESVYSVDRRLMCRLLPDHDQRQSFVRKLVRAASADRCQHAWSADVRAEVHGRLEPLNVWLQQGVPVDDSGDTEDGAMPENHDI